MLASVLQAASSLGRRAAFQSYEQQERSEHKPGLPITKRPQRCNATSASRPKSSHRAVKAKLPTTPRKPYTRQPPRRNNNENNDKMPRRCPTIKFRTSFANTIYDAMIARGWKETIVTRTGISLGRARVGLRGVDTMHLEPHQRLNHFRNGRELCRKICW